MRALDEMFSPVRCAHCNRVYDLGTVEVTARYVDCSVWKCPYCGTTVDDRGETGWKSRKDYYPIGRTELVDYADWREHEWRRP